MKKCSKCEILLSKENFDKSKSKKDGLNSWCKLCKKEYRKENLEKTRAYSKDYYNNHKKELLNYKKEYKKRNKNILKEKNKLYREKNIEKIKKYHIDHYKNNKDKHKEYYEENKDRYKRNKIQKTYNISLEEWNRILDEQKGKCAICGKNDEKFKRSLATDHCHKSGKIRGILCFKCNSNLGIYEKYKEEFEKYLEKETNYGFINNIIDKED